MNNSVERYLFEEVVSELLEGEEGGAAVVVDPFVDILQLNDLPDLWRQRLQKNIGKSHYKTLLVPFHAIQLLKLKVPFGLLKGKILNVWRVDLSLFDIQSFF